MNQATVTRIIESADVTNEVLRIAEETEEWFIDSPIDWDEFLDRMDDTELSDGTRICMGESVDSPAIRKIKRHIRKCRQEGS